MRRQSSASVSLPFSAAAAHLSALDADVLLLQEVRDWDTCERLTRALAPSKYEVLVCSAFRDPFGGGIGRQQVAILGRTPAQSAWSERWTSVGRVDPPRGFAFAAIRLGTSDVGFYSLHLKSNLTMGSAAVSMQQNIAKREIAAEQLMRHVSDIQERTMPSVTRVVVGGDFNTNKDQSLFVSEKTRTVTSHHTPELHDSYSSFATSAKVLTLGVISVLEASRPGGL